MNPKRGLIGPNKVVGCGGGSRNVDGYWGFSNFQIFNLETFNSTCSIWNSCMKLCSLGINMSKNHQWTAMPARQADFNSSGWAINANIEIYALIVIG